MARHLPFTLCAPTVQSPGKGFQISLGNHSQNLQHILVPDASCSRTLKAITQTPKDPEGGLCTVSKCGADAGASWNCLVTPGPLSCDCLVVSLTVHQEESGVESLVSGGQANVPLFPPFLKALFVPRWSQTCLNYCQSEMQMSIGLFIGLSHP